MKKTFLLLSISLFGASVSAQVGIGTSDPKATLHVVSKATESSSVDGIIPPTVTKFNLANKNTKLYDTAQIGAIVYVSEISNVTSGKSLSQAVNINSPGYYYFDGSFWQKFTGDSTDDAWVNNAPNKRVELATSSLGTARSSDQNLYVQDNGQVGVGTPSPTAKLHINGNLKIETMDTYNANVAKPVYWNPETKSLSTTQIQRPFYNFKYKLRASVNEDWINNFNTKIDASKYTLIITSAVLKQSNLEGETFTGANSNAYINLFDVDNTSDKASDLKQVLPNIVPFKENNTWRIRVDFVNTAPYRKNSLEDAYFLWDIDVLVINNNSIYTIEDQFYKLDSNAGNALKDPIPAAVTTP